ncbi:MAG: hypothetical protein RLZZ15_584 [Verrucomicrobiota bacterium]|jgi:hypothetical protein
MHDPFTGQTTRLRGPLLPGPDARHALQNDHERRLAALARLGAAAAQCGVGEDSDGDLVTLLEDEVALLVGSGENWDELDAAIRAWRALVPLMRLDQFGFPEGDDGENPLEEPNEKLRRIGGGVEAWCFAAPADGGSVYKFYLPREEKRIGSEFLFRRGEESALLADAGLGDYRALLEKLLLVHALGGMATEVIAVTPEGILVAKQALGDPLPQGDDVSALLPRALIEIPSRFLRANRDHPRLFFLERRAGRDPGADARPFLVADLHARNFVRCADGALRVIDLVAAPWPTDASGRDSLIARWLEEKRRNPAAPALGAARDDEL